MNKGILTAIFIGVLILVSGCTSSYRDVKSQSEEMACPELNIPNDITLSLNQFDNELWSIEPTLDSIKLPTGIVEDDEKLSSQLGSCKLGTKEGENSNHFYCDPWFLKKITSSATGEITDEEPFTVLLEFEKTEGKPKLFNTKCYKG